MSAQNVQKIEPQTALVPTTPMEMLNMAVERGASIEVLEKLMALQERWEANQARKAFSEAIAAARAEIPVIEKTRHVGFKSKKQGAADTSYWHEDMATIARTVDPILTRYGLSYRFRTTSNPNEPVTVTCIISHKLGHSEENTLAAGRDESGNKNHIQGIGSTVTYLQRYTLKAALGLSATKDDDGATSEPVETITQEQADTIRDTLEANGKSRDAFLKWAEVEKIEDIPADQYESCMKAASFKPKAQS